MLYSLYELGHLSVAPLRIAAMMQSSILRSPLNPVADTEIARTAAAASDLFETVTRRYRKPDWNLPRTVVNGAEVPVTVKSAWASPWCDMLHFERDADALKAARGERTDPTVLLVAPMSGHYATLLRSTVGSVRSPRAAFSASASRSKWSMSHQGEAPRWKRSCPSTKSTSPIGPTRAWCRCSRAGSISTTTSITSWRCCACSAPRRMWSPCASRARSC
jgi:hypothetical protein